AFNLNKIEYLMQSYMEMAERVHESVRTDLSPRQQKAADERLALMRDYFSHYHGRRALYTMEKDKFFLGPVRPFFEEMEKYAEITSRPYTNNPSGLWNRVKKKARSLTGP